MIILDVGKLTVVVYELIQTLNICKCVDSHSCEEEQAGCWGGDSMTGEAWTVDSEKPKEKWNVSHETMDGVLTASWFYM